MVGGVLFVGGYGVFGELVLFEVMLALNASREALRLVCEGCPIWLSRVEFRILPLIKCVVSLRSSCGTSRNTLSGWEGFGM